MSILIVVSAGVLSEAALRIAAVEKHNRLFVGNVHLLPRQWRDYAEKQQRVLVSRKSANPYFVDDDTLGWTVGSNRKSINGLYESSAEGLRSATQGEAMRDGLGDCRVALVGDSFTFGNDVRFADTWGYRLEQRLPDGCRVLNFGVSGFGIDQMYLRYMRDVPSWKPTLVVLSFINHDLFRAMGSSGFLLFDENEFPFIKPRFVLDRGGRLDIVNRPLPKAEDIFKLRYIHEVPFIEYDRAYIPAEWDRPMWWFMHRSYLARFLTSLFPLQAEGRRYVSDEEMRALNQALLKAFVAAVRQDGGTPVLVYLPSGKEEITKLPARIPDGLKILNRANLEHVDLTGCLETVSESDRFVPSGATGEGGHYTPRANAAIAACLAPTVLDRLRLALARQP
ncbi:MAG: SGNH/GDSL hydrolase family protein [Nitrospira sp.]|nr:SGNH/GDSL hydrolase family protein [Nitrospira sp.]